MHEFSITLAVVGLLGSSLAFADSARISLPGTPGHVDTPSAEALADGDIALSWTAFQGTSRIALAFQATPRLTAALRYSTVGEGDSARYDRSFDIHAQLLGETARRPSVAIGLRDIAGTGLYSSEYIVLTKRLGQMLSVTGGLGWGRLGGAPRSVTDDLGGVPDAGQWFSGSPRAFGALQWSATNRLSLSAEYSPDPYFYEKHQTDFEGASRINLRADYRFDNGVTVGVQRLHGGETGIAVNFMTNPARARIPGGREKAPLPVLRRPVGAASDKDGVIADLETQEVGAEAVRVSGDKAVLYLKNDTFEPTAEAVGRAARAMSRNLGDEVESFDILTTEMGVPVSRVSLNRRDIETLEHDFDGAAQLRARATVTDAGEMRADHIAGAYPKADIDIGAFLSVGLFDPDSPLRGEVGAALSAEALLMPGLALSGQVRVPVAGNLEDAVRESDSVLPHVRSDSVLYDRDGAIEISHLTAEHLFRPGRAIFGRVSAGYLERMYGGVSGELLWQPATSPLGLGVELNYARQRDYAGLLGFRDYDVVTGHASAYYSLGGGYRAQLDLGRYLAGDWGATFTLERSFANGWRVGGFFTLTDVAFDDFGEGSFDKGIQLRIPVSWLTGEPSRGGFATTLRPVTRDGGARLEVRNRLYDVVRRDLGTEFDAGWTRVWR